MGGRALLFSVLLALPSALIVGVGGWLIAREVPRLVKYEPVRIGREYRERAEEMAQSKSSGAWKAIERRVGWRCGRRLLVSCIWHGKAVARRFCHLRRPGLRRWCVNKRL